MRLSYDERRAQLIDAAVRVIARDGIAAASTRAIVAEAGMPLGAFHYVFASRDELLSAVVEAVTDEERLAAWIDADTPLQPSVPIEVVLRRGLEAYLRLLEADPARELALLEVAQHALRHDPEAARAQWATYRRATSASLAYACELTGMRWMRPLEEIAYSLNSALDGLTLTWLTDRDSEVARRHIAFLAQVFAALAEPDPEAAPHIATATAPASESPSPEGADHAH